MPPPPPPSPTWPIPTFNFHVEDLSHAGSILFFDNINDVLTALRTAATEAFRCLYTPETAPTNVKTVLFLLRSMPGVAHTFGDAQHKQIHLSLDHIVNSSNRVRDEVLGVITHEIVHCFQYNGKGKCPGGLIEGIADYVRLRADLSPPHWKPTGKPGEKWDAGYEKTAYFLNWIENKYGNGTVRNLNAAMRDTEYGPSIFIDATTHDVDTLWKMYCDHIAEFKQVELALS